MHIRERHVHLDCTNRAGLGRVHREAMKTEVGSPRLPERTRGSPFQLGPDPSGLPLSTRGNFGTKGVGARRGEGVDGVSSVLETDVTCFSPFFLISVGFKCLFS